MRKRTSAAQAEKVKYGKRQLLASKRFAPLEKDVLQALLPDGETYTVAEAGQLLDQYSKLEAK
ncbi:hypothetical protein [Cohnella caldifontis]|uniref:hypothetical protein n=1 Tax=Cohnella caldifontis TaxID=3027471 RepID=UPI0023EDD248|nr:hypothetical protein [Cohnella sp. YIM B05605]